MANRWVVEPDYPGGHLVPMTTTEEAQWAADQAAGTAANNAYEAAHANALAMGSALAGRMTSLRQARVALAGGSIFAALSVNERKVIDMLLQDDLQFARLILEQFEATDA